MKVQKEILFVEGVERKGDHFEHLSYAPTDDWMDKTRRTLAAVKLVAYEDSTFILAETVYRNSTKQDFSWRLLESGIPKFAAIREAIRVLDVLCWELFQLNYQETK